MAQTRQVIRQASNPGEHKKRINGNRIVAHPCARLMIVQTLGPRDRLVKHQLSGRVFLEKTWI
jgi:hypothetical protein